MLAYQITTNFTHTEAELFCTVLSLLLLSNCVSVYKRSHEFVSVCESVGVSSDSIGSNNKLNVRSVVRSKFAGVIF